jgi:disulfide bond formation protein DsbB
MQQSRLFLRGALAIASAATFGSLWFGGDLGFGLNLFPCRLCWYQRIAMYPLVVVLGVAVFDDDTTVYRTALPLAVAGGVVSGAHVWMQVMSDPLVCSSLCATVQYRVGGVLTIPMLALIAFVSIAGLLTALMRGHRR